MIGNYPIGSSNFIIDEKNSSNENLNAGNFYSFIGSASRTSGFNCLKWSLKTDRNAMIYIEQSPDGTNWDISYSHYYNSLKGGQGETVQATQAYWRIRVVLTLPLDTSFFRLTGSLSPSATSLPSSLNDDLRQKIESHITGPDEQNRHVWVSPRNQLISTGHIRVVGKNFDGNVKDTNFWTETVANGGTVVQSGGGVTLNTNTTANGSAKYESTKRARFVSGTTQFFLARTTSQTNVIENNVRRIGPYDANDGLFFQAADVFGIGHRIGGVDTIIEDGNFNGFYGRSFPTNINVYFSILIEWTPTAAYWYIDGKLLHKIEGLLLVSTNSLPITIENINSNGLDQAIDFTCVEAAIMRQGDLSTDPINYRIQGLAGTHFIKKGAGKLQRIVIGDPAGTEFILYDSLTGSGKIILPITTSLTSSGPWEFDTPFSNGLTIVTIGNGLEALVVAE